MGRIIALFEPPRFADEEKTRQAFLLNIILWVLIFVPIPLVVYTLFFSPEIWSRVLTQALFGEAVNVFLLVLLRRGYVRTASLIQIAAFWSFFTATAWTGAGVHSQAYQIGQALVISLAGFLIGVRGALIMVGLSLLSGGLMVAAADLRGWSFKPPDKALTIWVVSAILFPILAVLQYLAGRLLRMALDQSRMSQARYRNLVEHIPQRIFIKDLNSVYVSCNDNYARDLRIQPERIAGKDDFAFYPKELAEGYRADDRAVIESGVPKDIEERYVVSGQERWIHTTKVPYRDPQGRVIGVLGIFNDITVRKSGQETLRMQTHQIEVVRGVVEEITRELNLDRLLELILRRANELVKAEGGVIVLWDEDQKALFPRVRIGDYWANVPVRPIPLGEGVVGRIAETRKGIVVNDYRTWPGARPTMIQSSEVTAALGQPLVHRDKLIGAISLAHTGDRGKFEEHQLKLLGLFANQAAIAIENARLYEEAQTDAIELHTRLQQIAAAQREKEDLTRQLYQAQKLEAIGTLAGGIAHDFNNILAPIIMGAELALMTTPVENPAHPMMQKVLTAGMRAKDLVQQILAFSRQSDLERRPMRLGPLLKETIKLARASLPATIEIRQNVNPQKDLVLANPTQVHQVMMNLFANAGHAMRANGGVLEVTLEEEIVEDGRAVGVPDIRAGHFAKLMVNDTGHGMDSPTLERIFNPFFTTKERGEGTGLGLSIVHGIIKSYDGAITVKSQPGQGTSFTIWIPLVEVEAKDQAPEPVPLPLGHERILFVDDEPFIVEISRQILERLGYRVDTRTDPLDALEMFKRDPGLYDLIITDMTMPKMTGDRLAIELLRMRPEIPILLCTGFSERMTEAAALRVGIKGFIMKPIAVAEIARKVREALGDEKTGE
jgi:PAS domain S-box-containing protein